MQLLVPLDKIEKTLKYFKKICFVRLKFICKYYIVPIIENENKQMWFASSIKEVRRMVELQNLIATIYILYYSLIGISIITFALIIALVVIISKQK